MKSVLGTKQQQVGAVELCGIHMMLCDYLQQEGTEWYALAYLEDDTQVVKNDKIISRKMGKERLRVLYIPQDLVAQAKPERSNDGETRRLIERLARSLKDYNSGMYGTFKTKAA
jgi:hypothetical protein